MPADSSRPPDLIPISRRDQRNALLASFLGWTLDAFDFFVVVMVLTEIAKDFNRSNADIALTLSVTLAFRPVGAFLFGLMADRYGRRIPLMVDVVFYSVVGFLPGFAYQCGVLIAGTVAYLEAIFARRMNYANAMAFTALTVFLICALAVALGREKKGIEFGT